MSAAGYELWDLESGNLVAYAQDREELLAYVRRVIEEDGEECALRLGLSATGQADGAVHGEALVALALQPAHP